jgi:hypothetical protein
MAFWPLITSGGIDPKESRKATWSVVFGALGLLVGTLGTAFAVYAWFASGNKNNTQAPNNAQYSASQLQTASHTASFSAPSNLDLQAQCAAQAQKTLIDFQQSMESVGSYDSFSQQNSYSSDFGECFEIISYSPTIPPGTKIDTPANAFAYPTEVDTFRDAYKNNDLADCIFYDNLVGVEPQAASNPDSYIKCTIGNSTVTYQQLKDYINQRMGAGTVQ